MDSESHPREARPRDLPLRPSCRLPGLYKPARNFLMLSIYFWHTRISFPKDLVKTGKGQKWAGWGNNSAPPTEKNRGNKEEPDNKRKKTRRQVRRGGGGQRKKTKQQKKSKFKSTGDPNASGVKTPPTEAELRGENTCQAAKGAGQPRTRVTVPPGRARGAGGCGTPGLQEGRAGPTAGTGGPLLSYPSGSAVCGSCLGWRVSCCSIVCTLFSQWA